MSSSSSTTIASGAVGGISDDFQDGCPYTLFLSKVNLLCIIKDEEVKYYSKLYGIISMMFAIFGIILFIRSMRVKK